MEVEDDVKPHCLKWKKRSCCDGESRLDKTLLVLGAKERSTVCFFRDALLRNSSLFPSSLSCNKQSIPFSSSPTPRPP